MGTAATITLIVLFAVIFGVLIIGDDDLNWFD